MAIIPGVTVDWSLSPRVIIIPIPITEAVVADMQDTLLDIEDSDEGICFPKLRDCSGGQDLGGGVYVGWTIQLNNAKIMFEGRTEPCDGGTATANDSSGKFLTDSAAHFTTNPLITPGCTVFNVTTGEMGTITEIISDTQLKSTTLSGMGENGWTINDDYVIYVNEQCTLSGGNWTAIDENGDSISPILQSPNVSIVMTSSSSATLQESMDIQYSSFNGGVTVDTTSIYSGTEFPVGTPREPVNNLEDALSIASERGFSTFYILGNITLDDSFDFTQYTFIGESPDKTTITVNADATTDKCEFYECTLTGILDGECKVKNSVLGDVNYISGYVELCVLNGEITLGGGASAYFLDCWAGTNLGLPPVINLGGSGQTLVMQNFNGYIKWRNKTGTEQANASLNAGWIVLENTITNGNITIIGTGVVEDNSVGATVDISYLVNPNNISSNLLDTDRTGFNESDSVGESLNEIMSLSDPIDRTSYNNMVTIDTSSSYSGTEFPVGTYTYPVNNLADAISIATDKDFRKFRIIGNFTLHSGESFQGFYVEGDHPNLTSVTLESGSDIDGSIFSQLKLTGTCSGVANIEDCKLVNLINLSALTSDSNIIRCQLSSGTIRFANTSSPHYQFNFVNCWSGAVLDMSPIIDVNDCSSKVLFRNHSGAIRFQNITEGQRISLDFVSGRVRFDASCTDMDAVVRGSVVIQNNSGIEIDDSATLVPVNESLSTINTSVDTLLDVEQGNWKIINNQMIFYTRAGGELMRFDLLNAAGDPSMTEVFERQIV